MAGYNVGTAYVEIAPSFDNFVGRVAAEGDTAGRNFIAAFNNQLRNAVVPHIGPSNAAIAGQGFTAGAKFSESFKAALEASLRNLPDITINANSTQADREIAALRTRLRTLADAKIGVDISSADAVKEMESIRTELKRLGAASTDIDVKVDIDRAIANLEQLRAEIKRVNGDDVRVRADTKKARKEMNLLRDGIILLAPAAIYAGAVVGGALAGIVPIAAAAGLAVLGVRDAWKSGALQGSQFETTVGGLRQSFVDLKAASADAILPGLTAGAEGLRVSMGPLRGIVTGLSEQMGRVASVTGPALGRLFVGLAPLGQVIGNVIENAANRFAAFTQGSGVTTFVDYVTANLPRVLEALGDLGTLFINLSSAAAPFGQIVLTALGALSSAIDAIPRDVLSGLVTTILAGYAAFRLFGIAVTIIRGVSVAIGVLQGAYAALALRMAATRAAMLLSLGVLGLVAAAVGVFAFAMNSSSNNTAGAKQAMDDYAESVKQSTDALNAANVAATQKQLADRGALSALDALHRGNNALGISYQDLASAVNGSEKQFRSVSDALKSVISDQGANSAMGGQALILLSTLEQMRGGLLGQIDVQKAFGKSLQGNQTDLNAVAIQLGITAEQAKTYAETLGLVVTDGGIVNESARTVRDAITTVQYAFNNATQTGAAFLDTLKQFGSSDGGASARADLIAATLKAANGDALNYASAMVTAAGASRDFGSSIRKAAKDADQSTAKYLAGIINLRTGTIRYNATGAKPLVAALGQIQSAGLDAARATYQHLRATVGGKEAAKAAYSQYVGQTRTQLIDQLTRLTGNADAAKRLADRYFGMPKKVKTLITQEGADPVVTVLRQIRDVLAQLTGTTWDIDVTARISRIISDSRDALNNGGGKDIGDTGRGVGGLATGGSAPDGLFAVGEEGPELAYKRGSSVQIMSNPQSRAFIAATGLTGVPGFAGGTSRVNVGQLFSDNRFLNSVIVAVSNSVSKGVTVALRRSPIAPLASYRAGARSTVLAGIAAAVRPEDTSIGRLRTTLSAQQGTAITRRQTAERAEDIYGRAAKNAAALERNASRVNAQVAEFQRRSRKEQNRLQNVIDDAAAAARKLPTGTKEQRAAKKAAEDRVAALRKEARENARTNSERIANLRKEAKAADSAADRGKKAADRAKDSWKKASDAADTAAKNAADAAKAVVESIQSQADALADSVKEFRDSVVDGLSAGTDLATMWGKVTDAAQAYRDQVADLNTAIIGNVGIGDLWQDAIDRQTTAQQRLADARQAVADATPDTAELTAATAAYDQARAQLAAAQQAVAGAGGTPEDYTRLAIAQRTQTDALARLTAAQRAANAVTGPTTEQLTELAAAEADAAAAGNDTASALATVAKAFRDRLAGAADFSADLEKVTKAGLSLDVVRQIAGMGAEAGDQLAKAILAAGPDMIAQLNQLGAQAATTLSGALAAAGTDPGQSAAALQAQFNQTLSSTQRFAEQLAQLVRAGAGQDVISQVVGLGVDAGSGLAAALLQAGPDGIKALQTSMAKISGIADSAGDALSGVFFAKGQRAMASLIDGLVDQFPALQSALKPIVDSINGALNSETAAGANAGLTSSHTLAATHTVAWLAEHYGLTVSKFLQLNPQLKNATSKTVVGKGRKITVPSFETGVADFAGPLAFVHAGELLVNNRAPGMDVITAPQVQKLISVSQQFRSPTTSLGDPVSGGTGRFEGDLYLDSGEFLGHVRGAANQVVDARVASARQRQQRRVQGGPLEHLARR